jgi:hypothetical protein
MLIKQTYYRPHDKNEAAPGKSNFPRSHEATTHVRRTAEELLGRKAQKVFVPTMNCSSNSFCIRLGISHQQ